MALSTERMTIGAASVALHSADSGPSGTTLVIQAVGTAGTHDVCIGPSTVTALTGTLLAPGDPRLILTIGAGEQLYAIRQGAADGTLRVLRLGE